MSIRALRSAVATTVSDEALQRDLVAIWPLVESILEAFANATRLPIFVYLDSHHVYQSSLATMPPFCKLMLQDHGLAARCVADGALRATVSRSEAGEPHLCHAGLMNSRRQVDTGCGPVLSILFGSRQVTQPEAQRRLESLLVNLEGTDPVLAKRLRECANAGESTPDQYHKNWRGGENSGLMDAIATIIERLLAETVGVHALSINLAHEVSLVLVGMAALGEEMADSLSALGNPSNSSQAQASIRELAGLQRIYSTQAQLGLHVVRNFLSYTSELRYGEVTRPQFERLNLATLVSDMIDIHRPLAEKRGITFETQGLDELPRIRGVEMEIRRLLYNILNNAVKYSYHSTGVTHRTIRIGVKIPFDPGFSQRRFALTIGNYGLGLDKDEKTRVFHPGFRGRQARIMVPVGAGIGLSEATKIMKIHKGSVRINSTELHAGPSGEPTYLTTVDLIFPYGEDPAER